MFLEWFTFVDFICMLIIYKSPTVLAFLIYRNVIMKLIWICSGFDCAGARLMDWNWVQKRVRSYWFIVLGCRFLNQSFILALMLLGLWYLGFVLNENLTAADQSKRVCQRIYSILRSIRPHASHTPFPVRRRFVRSLVTTHTNYGNIVYSSVDVGLRGRIRVAFNTCLKYIHRVRPRDHIAHLESSVTGMSLETSARAQTLTIIYKILHVRHPSYIFFLFHFTKLVHRTSK
jgi:hypothetical protein